MSESKPPRQTRKIADFDHRIGPIPLSRLDQIVGASVIAFIVIVAGDSLLRFGGIVPYGLLRELHYHLSRFSLVIALGMLAIAFYIGIIRHADVTPYFRRGAYVVIGTMLLEALIGVMLLLVIGVRPGEDVHIIYGVATVLTLPFFIFVEKTAEKRPAMGSYLWGFAILAGIIIRSIGTGPQYG